MAFVPEGQADSSQARSAWVAMQKGPRPGGTVEVMVRPEWHEDKAVWDVFFCPAGAVGFSPGFQPWETSKKPVRPEKGERSRGPKASDCYRKGKRYLLG